MRAASTLAVVLVLSVGCAGARPAQRQRVADQNAIPGECAAAVARAALLGEAMYEQDGVGAWATDALFREGSLPSDQRVRGWVTTREGARWASHWLGMDGEELLELYTVEFDAWRGDAARVSRLEPPRRPSTEVATMFRARKTAAEQPFRACSERYNTVVLPGALAGESGWLVYLLAATSVSGEVVIGGHVRRLVSQNGLHVEKSEEMSKDCLTVRVAARPDLEAFAVTNLLWPCPVEVHVWLSLLHRKPVFLATRTGLWFIEGTTIRYLGPIEKDHE